jgi:hypothetical protein
MDINTPIDLRLELCGELAQYIAPEHKAIEHTGDPARTGTALGLSSSSWRMRVSGYYGTPVKLLSRGFAGQVRERG